ncbi:hypothetical protein [Staphylococcus gallinarum]|uniref:hypothetical protein n=1 Tax=Staphylococcus gallinarum TaxID=1293 RepID=UPI001F53EAC3|nr:hypothetical protein [Staphylococcus gallinarum]
MAKPVKVHELNKDDEIWFRASEHNISYPAVVVDLIDDFESDYPKAEVHVGTHKVYIDDTYQIVKLDERSESDGQRSTI